MAYSVGETVHVPTSKLSLKTDYAFSMAAAKVVEVSERFIKVDLRDGNISEDIPLSLVRKKLGVVIIEIGDFKTEGTLLNPLKKSILQFTRLLLSDDYIKNYSIRTPEELKIIWNNDHRTTSHLVLVGHGDANSINFGENNLIKFEEFLTLLTTRHNVGEAKQIISLCCKTGNKSFGGYLSGSPIIESFIGPSGSVHGANASLFYQSYLTYYFLQGLKSSTAFEYAKASTPGTSDFLFWRKKVSIESRTPLKISR